MADLVVDACVALKWFLEERDSEKAVALFSVEHELYAPDCLLIETANGLWKNVRLGRIPATVAVRAVNMLPSFFTALLPFEDLVDRAFDLAMQIDHPVYDCAYAAAALQLGYPLVTDDAKLASKLKAAKSPVASTLLRDWRP